MPLDPTTNVGLTTTAPGARSFRAFCATIEQPETKQENIFTMHVIPDDEDDESFQPKDPVKPPHTADDSNEEIYLSNKDEAMKQQQTTVVDLGPITISSQRIRSLSHWNPRMSYCGGIIALDICLLTASNNLPIRGSCQNVCSPVTCPFAPLASTAR